MTWSLKPLSEILDQSGHRRAGEQDLPVLSITMKHGLIDQADKFKKRIASSDTSNYRIAYKNELVVGFPIDEGVLGFQTKYPAGIVSPAYDVWKLKAEAECHIPYLERYLRSRQARSLYASRMQGAVARRRSLTKPDFLELEIPFPPIHDQVRIAYLLESVDALVTQRTRQLRLLDELLKSVFEEFFGDVVLNEKSWKIDSLANLGQFKNGLNFGNGETGIQVRCLGVGDFKALSKIVNTKNLSKITLNIAPSEDYYLRNGDLVFVRSNGNKDLVGRCVAVYPNDERITYSGFCIRYRLRDTTLDPTFLAHLFRAPAFKRLMLKGGQGSNIQNINQKSLSALPIPLPPPDLQRKFVRFVEKTESVGSECQQNLNDLEDLYGTLSQLAFIGALDMSRVPLPDAITQPSPAEVSLPPSELTAPAEVMGEPMQLVELQTRGALLTGWLRQYLANQSPDTSLDAAQLLEAAWQSLQNARPEEGGDTLSLNMPEYDTLKELIFEALDAGELRQTFDDDGNRVALKTQPADWGTW